MPQVYKRKTQRGSSAGTLQQAADAVQGGLSIRSAAADHKVDRMTLTRYIAKQRDNSQAIDAAGYVNCKLRNMIFSLQMEAELAQHIKSLAACYHGLSKAKCCSLAYEFAIQNNIDVPENWRNNKSAGEGFWLGFKNRQNLSIRSPEATSLARATAFNRYTVGKFFTNLADIMDRHQFQAQNIYNIDETGCTTVQKPGSVVVEKGIKQVGSVTSAERGELVTVVNSVNASGSVLPPMFIFPRVNYREYFIRGGPVGSKGAATKSGWINEELFTQYLDHFIHHARCTPNEMVLLIMDNHESHVSLRAVDKAKANGIVLLTIPPHTSHKLQPLDKAVYGPYKKAYGRAMDAWIRSNPGKTLSIYDIPGLVNEAQISSCVPRNVLSGFQSTGIFPYNSDIFTEADYAPAAVTDRLQVVSSAASNCEKSASPAVGDGEQNILLQSTLTSAILGEEESTSEKPSNIKQHSEEMLGNTEIISFPESTTSSSISASYVSPKDILPLPKAGPRKNKATRRRGDTKILIDTPIRDGIAAALHGQKKKKAKPARGAAKKKLFCRSTNKTKQKRKISESSSSESDMELELNDDSDSEEEVDQEIFEGNFVVVKIHGKSRVVHYVGRVDAIDGNEFEGVFLQRVLGRNKDMKDSITFVVNEDDGASWSHDDIAEKLPSPSLLGTSHRTQFQFPCNFDKWNLK